MGFNRNFYADLTFRVAVIAITTLLVACGQGTTSSTATSTTGGGSNGSSTLTTIPTTTGNTASIVVDAGPVVGSPSINVPYVSVTICTPGTSGSTAACQTIDHVTLDTGSYGLRLLHSVISSNLNLPAVTSNGQAMGECVPFVLGVTWGSVRTADIYIGGEVAKNIPIQDIGDTPGGAPSVPTDCSNTGKIQDTQAALGSNGILGVGLFVNDCDACLTSAISAAYYTCTSTGCSNSIVTSSQVVRNPVASFAADNNGTLISLPAVSVAGATSLTGSIIFGIGTQTNNQPSGVTAYQADSAGNFTTIYNGTTMSKSYLDSGSNAYFFVDTTGIAVDSSGWYVPTTSPLNLTATNKAAVGTNSGTVNFSLVNILNLPASIMAANIGGKGSSGSFAWGLPFFFGRPVFTVISGQATQLCTGPCWAY